MYLYWIHKSEFLLFACYIIKAVFFHWYTIWLLEMGVSSLFWCFGDWPWPKAGWWAKHSSVSCSTERRGKKHQHLTGLILWTWRTAIADMAQPTFFFLNLLYNVGFSCFPKNISGHFSLYIPQYCKNLKYSLFLSLFLFSFATHCSSCDSWINRTCFVFK